jgi:translation initiation factor IF-2
VRDLAERMHKSPIEIIKTLMNYGMMVTITESIDFDTAALIGEELGIEVKPEREPEPEPAEEAEEAPKTLRQRIIAEEKTENMQARPPVVVVLGHVDHGKTTLLDAIRETRVVEGEAGGITQHIGAYQVEVNGRKITFLDTPGHEAFTAMRARGAMVTDIAILVVAADDGVMPQTKEAISHVKAAQVPLIVALNKIDKAQSNPDRVKQELADNGVLIEEYGGDVMCVPVSAKMRRGIEDLLESVLLATEVDPQMANPDGECVGTVIESRLDKTRGPMATLLVQNGTLKVGDSIVSGETHARIRAMYDDKGEPITEALPAQPIAILGFSDVPVAGDTFKVVADDRTARALAEVRQDEKRAAVGPAPLRTLESIFAAAEAGQVKELNLILKADVQGSIEPIVNSLDKLSTDKLKVKVLHQGTGNITESDVMLAIASHAIIVGFSVVTDGAAQKMAEAEGVDIRIYKIIYNIIEDVQKALTGLLEPVYKEVVTGHAEIRQVFKVSKVGKVAGCYILDGEIPRNSSVRIKRNGEPIGEDRIAALKRFQEDVAEVKTGFECGIHLNNFNDFEVGDILEAYKKERVL